MSAFDLSDASQPHMYYDPHFKCNAAKILPGEYFAVADETLLVTVLGSCVAACIRDKLSGVGGMNHFMLPENMEEGGVAVAPSARYGTHAMEMLINRLGKMGARRNQLEAKVFGGGAVMKEITTANVGERNAAFVLDFLAREGIPVVAQDLLDDCPRKVYYFPSSGKVKVRKLRSLHNDTIYLRERAYQEQLQHVPVGGAVELF
jgi:chemotaxis protein CheD